MLESTGPKRRLGRRPQGAGRSRALAAVGLVGGMVLLVGCGLASEGSADRSSSPVEKPRSSTADRSSTAEPEPADEPLLVTGVEYVPRRDAQTWIHPSVVSEDDVDRLNREVHAAGGIGTKDGDAVMRRSGAVESTISTVELELEGNRDSPVRIAGVHAVPECRAPLDGTLFYSPVQGAYEVVPIGFDLDETNPIGRYGKRDPLDGPPEFTGDYFADHTYTLKRYQQITLRFSARSFKRYCEYRYRLDLVVDGKKEHQLVDDDGEPFRVSAEIQDEDGVVKCEAYDRHYFGSIFTSGVIDPETPWIPPEKAQPFVCG